MNRQIIPSEKATSADGYPTEDGNFPNASAVFTAKIITFAPQIGFQRVVRPKELKGNRVQIPDSPAAVSSIPTRDSLFLHWQPCREGGQRESKSEDLPSAN